MKEIVKKKIKAQKAILAANRQIWKKFKEDPRVLREAQYTLALIEKDIEADIKLKNGSAMARYCAVSRAADAFEKQPDVRKPIGRLFKKDPDAAVRAKAKQAIAA